ncbi:CCR4-NOT transcription complex subunit 2-like isoform X2 [Lineus longissimus]|uniref:CCR4-NOT transcription complex subunit 2-like isoform X2 n=1 Tax=Lineus longissimus TaxID=88925 RepID=UPI00315D5438
MAFNMNRNDNMPGNLSGMGQFGADNLTWNPQTYMGRKGSTDLSPGGRTKGSGTIGGSVGTNNLNIMGMPPPKPNKKDFFAVEEDNEASMYFTNPTTVFRPDKDPMQSPSPSQLSGLGSNLYGQPTGMASLALQQRGLGSQRNTTPTSGIGSFPISMQQQQSSPNRSMFSTVGQSRYMNQMNQVPASQAVNSYQKRSTPLSSSSITGPSYSTFSTGSRNQDQPNLDLSEFPTLGNRVNVAPNPMPNVRNYGKWLNMVSKPVNDSQPEFTIQQEDFPALPGSASKSSGIFKDVNIFAGKGNLFSDSSSGDSKTSGTPTSYEQACKDGQKLFGDKSSSKRMIQTHPDGTVSNIPIGMVTDQFGMVGLLTFIRAAETDPNLVALAPGIDLTTLGLNLNSPDNLYSTFQSPWADAPCRPQDIDYHVPSEYLTNIYVRDKLAPIKLNRYGEDLLFFLFYMNGGDVLQLAAAAELYNREWRYHKEERVWITRAPGFEPVVKTNSYERGTYYFFEVHNWRKVAKEFHLEYDKLEERPHLPPSLHHNQSQPILAH